MTAKDYRDANERMMTEITDKLSSISFRIIEHEYDYACFGSWYFVCNNADKEFRIVFDGKDSILCVQVKTEKDVVLKAGEIWKDLVSVRSKEPSVESVIKLFESAHEA